MTGASAAALFGAMLLLAALPSLSVLTVAARTVGAGLVHGALATLGIVIADVAFVLVAVYGLAALAGALDGLFPLLTAACGVYLLWLAWRMSQNPATSMPQRQQAVTADSKRASFAAGLMVTLGDQKALLFYFGFFPAFLDVGQLQPIDVLLIVLITVVAVGGTKLAYAWTAHRAGRIVGPRQGGRLQVLAAAVIAGVGLLLLAHTAVTLAQRW